MLFRAALKSREISDNSAQTAGEEERVRRWGGAGERGTPSCYDDGKALDSCLLQRAQAANVGAGLHLPLPDALIMVPKARAGSGKRTFKPLREGYLHHDIWPNLANEANYLRGPGTDFCHRSQHICEPPISYHIFSFSTFLS